MEWINENVAKSMFGFTKSNGLFKTAKHRNFIFSSPFGEFRHSIWLSEHISENGYTEEFRKIFKKNFGIELKAGQIAYDISGHIRWVNYGARSIRAVTHMFIFDRFGLVAQYKLKFVGDMHQHVVPEKTKIVWERNSNVELVEFVEEHIEKVESQFVSEIGSRIEISGKIIDAKFIVKSEKNTRSLVVYMNC